MFRKFLVRVQAAALILIVFGTCTMPASAVCKNATVVIHGHQVHFSPAACVVGDSAYVPLREFVEALDDSAEIQWDSGRQKAVVTLPDLTIEVRQGNSYIVANGHYLYLGGKVRNWEGHLMLPVAPLADALGVTVNWDPDNLKLSVTGEVKPLSYAYYDEYKLYWLSHIIHAEAGTESLEGMIAVGNVVLNRVRNDYWSSDIYDVIFDNSAGVQFSPTESGTIYEEPCAEAVLAAKLAMEGADVVGDSLFFLNPSISNSGWFDRNCEFFATIGNHRFYTCEYYLDGFHD